MTLQDNTVIKDIKKMSLRIKNGSRDRFNPEECINEEQGITYASIFLDLDKLIGRVIALCSTRTHFREVSTCTEREQILAILSEIREKIKKGEDFLEDFEKLKIELRIFSYIDYTKSYSSGLKDEVDKLRAESKSLIKEKNNLIKAIDLISKSLSRTKENIESSKENQAKLKTIGTKIVSYEDQLSKQKITHTKYNDDIKAFRKEKNNALKEAEDIISKAKAAMKLGEASGISAALQSQYNDVKGIKKDGSISPFLGARVWIWGAAVFTFIALGIGLWIGLAGAELKANVLAARSLLIFISLTGAWFCAGQYVKTSNIASDYAYKVSLAKSIVAFSEQLKVKNRDDASYQEYMKKVLDEIHQHPLRSYKKQESVTPIEKVVEKVLANLPKT